MEQTIQALGGILLRAIPTICLLLIVHFYIRAMLVKPLEKVLKERDQLTSGARQAAERSLAAAGQKARDYEIKFREAQTEVYKQQEDTRRQWLADHATHIAQARAATDMKVKAARESIASEAAAARQTLVETSVALAAGIARSLFARRAQ